MTSTTLSTVAPLTPERIGRLLRKIAASYPATNPMALKEYLSEMALMLAGYSEGVATAAVARAMGASPEFPPPVPLIKNHCDDLAGTGSDWARDWDMRSQQQLLERAEREAEEEPLEYRRAAAARILAEYHARCQPQTKPQRQTWRRFSEDDLRAIYPKREADDEPPPLVD